MIQNRLRRLSASAVIVCLAMSACERIPRGNVIPVDLALEATLPELEVAPIAFRLPVADGSVVTFRSVEESVVWPGPAARPLPPLSLRAAGSDTGVTLTYPFRDDLDILVDGNEPPERKGQAYERLFFAKFSTIALKLARLMGEYPPTLISGINYKPTQLERLWDYHVEQERRSPHFAGLMLKILEEVISGNATRDAEEDERGSLQEGRGRALREIEDLLRAGQKFSGLSESEFARILVRLGSIAFDARLLNSERRSVVGVLLAYDDPNRYLDLAIQLTEEVEPAWRKAEAFRFCTASCTAPRFTEANRRRYLRYCYKLLEESDDGRSGNGHFLTGTIASFLELPRVQEERGQRDAFTPDQRLPQYQGPTGLSESFYQDTVNNARKWWSENWARYEPEA